MLGHEFILVCNTFAYVTYKYLAKVESKEVAPWMEKDARVSV